MNKCSTAKLFSTCGQNFCTQVCTVFVIYNNAICNIRIVNNLRKNSNYITTKYQIETYDPPH